MIQRIQTLYLLLIVAIGIALCFLPVVQLTTPEEAAQQHMYEMKAIGLEKVKIQTSQNTPTHPSPLERGDSEQQTLTPSDGLGEVLEGEVEGSLKGMWGLLLTTLCIPVLALVDIFLYRKRILQARLNIFLAVLCVGYYGILAMFIWFAKMNLGTTEWHLYAWSGIPLICLVLTLMATRRILKDEALVRAADRLR